MHDREAELFSQPQQCLLGGVASIQLIRGDGQPRQEDSILDWRHYQYAADG
jgi:hypothetical protein